MSDQHHLISSEQLAAALSSGAPHLLLDVRPAEVFRCGHLPDAVNDCVFEIGFSERVTSLVSEKANAVYIYGDNGDTFEARMAAEKLVDAGFPQVFELREGIEGWKNSGYPVEGSSGTIPPPPSPLSGTRPINLEESRVEWIGRNLLNRHHGTLELRSGSLQFVDGLLTGGSFTFDMNGISCENLKGDSLHDVLVNHLQSHDFFDTNRYPEATFQVTSAQWLPDATPGSPNLQVTGELTLKNTTHVLSFEAVAGRTSEGHFAAQAVVAFDRTLWNVLYGSGKYFRNLGMHLVNDLIELHLRIVTR